MKKMIMSILSAIILLSVGFAAGFPVGQSIGFTTGSEWAFLQASLVARESGLAMPVNLVEGRFRIVLKQRRGLYRKTRQLADKYEEYMAYESVSGKELAKNESPLRGTHLTP